MRYGYRERDILDHTCEWLNYTYLFERDREVQQIRMKEGMRLQAARLTGIMFHDPEKGTEFYESLVATLNGEDNSDDDWLSNPNASTDLAALEGTIQRRIDERTNTSSSDGPNTDTSSS